MLAESQIIDGINAVLSAAHPNAPVHVNLVPADFSRRAFVILPAGKSFAPASCRLVFRTESYAVIEFLPTNEKGEASFEDLYAAQMRLAQLFMRPFAAGDRALTPTEVKATQLTNPGEIGIEIRLSFYDENEDSSAGNETDEMMEIVSIDSILENQEVINGTSPA